MLLGLDINRYVVFFSKFGHVACSNEDLLTTLSEVRAELIEPVWPHIVGRYTIE
jgi:hypothetical protein